MAREHGRPASSELPKLGEKPLQFEKYKSGATIVVWHEGNWMPVELQRDVTKDDLKNGRLTLEVQMNGSVENISVAQAPAVVEFMGGETFKDGRVSVNVDNAQLDEKGNIVYDVQRGTAATETVSQEVIKKWKHVLELEKKVARIKTKIKKIAHTSAEELIKRRGAIEEALAEARASLPEVGKGGESIIDAAAFDRLHANAEALLQELTDDVEKELTKKSERKEKKYTHHKATKAEKKRAKETNAEYTEERNELVDQMQEMITEIEQQITQEEEDKLKAKQDAEEQAYDYDAKLRQWKTDWRNWDQTFPLTNVGGGGGGRNNRNQNRRERQPTPPPGSEPEKPAPFDRKKVKLTKLEKEDIRKEVTARLVGEFYDALDGTAEMDKLKTEIDKRRKKKASRDVRNKKSIDSATGDYKIGARPDKASPFMDANLQVMEQLANEWKRDPNEERAEEFPEDAEVFDFDAEFGALSSQIESFIETLTNDEGVVPSGLKKIHKDAVDLKENVTNHTRDLATLDQAKSVFGSTVTNRGDLEAFRVSTLKTFLDALDGLAQKVQDVQHKKTEKEVAASVEKKKKEVAKARTEKQAEKKEVAMEVVDMPPNAIHELLESANNWPEAIKATREIYMGGGELTPAALDELTALFDNITPDPALLEKLNITNWDSFKTLWKEKLAKQVGTVMAKHAEQTMQKMLAEQVGTWQKLKKTKWRVIGRALMTMGIVGAGSAATVGLAGLLLPASLGGAAMIAGGAAGGALRGKLFQKLFGSEKSQRKQQKEIEELMDTHREKIVTQLLNEQFGSGAVSDSALVGPSAPGRSPVTVNATSEGSRTFTAVLSETARMVTGSQAELVGKQPDEAANLTASEKLLYKNIIERLEPGTVDLEQKKNLAITLMGLRRHGNVLESQVINETDPKVVQVVDSLMGNFAGKNGIGRAAFSGAVISSFYAAGRLANSDVSGVIRGTMGAIGFGLAGYKWADGIRQNRERAAARAELMERLKRVEEANYQKSRAKGHIPPGGMDAIHEDIIAIRRLASGNASQYEVGAIATKPAGSEKAIADEMLVSRIQSVLHETERTGLAAENESKEAHRLDHIMHRMKEQGDKIAEEQFERFATKLKRGAFKWGSRLVGAGVGAVAGYFIGSVVGRTAGEYVGNKVNAAGNAMSEVVRDLTGIEKSGTGQGLLGDAFDKMRDGLTGGGESPSDAGNTQGGVLDYLRGRLDELSDDVQSRLDDLQAKGESLWNDMREGMAPDAQAERLGLLDESLGGEAARGKNVLHLANQLQKNPELKDFIVAREMAVHPEYQGLSENQVIHKWRVGLAKDAGWDFNTQTYDKTPLFQVKDASGTTHTIEYKPYIKPDGTVGIKADDMFIREHGAKAFPQVPKAAPELPPEPRPAPMLDKGQPVPRFVAQSFNGETWQFSENDLDANGRPHKGAVGMRMENGKPVYMQWNDTKPVMINGRQEGVGGWDKIGRTEGQRMLAESAGAKPGNFDIGTYTNAKEHFGLTDSQLDQMQNVGYVETNDGGVFVRDARGGIVRAGGGTDTEQLTPTKPYDTVTKEPSAVAAGGSGSRTAIGEGGAAGVRDRADALLNPDTGDLEKVSQTFNQFYDTEQSATGRINALRELLKANDGAIEHNGLRYTLGTGDTVKFETESGAISRIVTKDNIDVLTELDEAYRTPGDNSDQVKEIVGRFLSGREPGESTPVVPEPLSEAPPVPESSPQPRAPEPPVESAPEPAPVVAAEVGGPTAEQVAVYNELQQKSGTAVAFSEAAVNGHYNHFLPGVEVTPDMQAEIDAAVQEFNNDYTLQDQDMNDRLKAELLQKIDRWRSGNTLASI